MIKVLIVDDSKVVQELLVHILSSDPEIKIVGTASSGREAIQLAIEKKPDLITMDYHMPDIDGSEATRTIMAIAPTPIIIVSGSLSTKEVSQNFSLIEDGALAVLLRPPGINHPDFIKARNELIKTIKLMSEVKVVRRFKGQQKVRDSKLIPTAPESFEEKEIRLIAIGASTGGPAALQKMLSGLPKDLPVPVLIVQHISPGFVNGFVEWLSSSSAIPLKIVSDGQPLEAGKAYVAPDGCHMGIRRGPVLSLSNTPPENGLRPAVDVLFRSVADVIGQNAIGVLLTGMGKDGAAGLKIMMDRGAITIAQDEESSIIFGMPGEAVKIGAAMHVLHIDKIAGFITQLVMKSEKEMMV